MTPDCKTSNCSGLHRWKMGESAVSTDSCWLLQQSPGFRESVCLARSLEFFPVSIPRSLARRLRTLATLSHLEIDLTELQRQADNVQNQLGSLLLNLREQLSEDDTEKTAEELSTAAQRSPVANAATAHCGTETSDRTPL
ncbi:MAG UNVERIFIED_CONTAM: hypothetical protein LVR18_13750 [Planctomycetaceae bacterium]|jgi:hypothetical protein